MYQKNNCHIFNTIWSLNIPGNSSILDFSKARNKYRNYAVQTHWMKIYQILPYAKAQDCGDLQHFF